jgi:hypothetical protein
MSAKISQCSDVGHIRNIETLADKFGSCESGQKRKKKKTRIPDVLSSVALPENNGKANLKHASWLLALLYISY